MKRTSAVILILTCASSILVGCNSSNRQAVVTPPSPRPSPVFIATPGPVPTPVTKPKPLFIKLDPKFRLVVQRLKFQRVTGKDNKKQEQIFVIMDLTHKGPRPKWWGKHPQLYSLSFTTSEGKIYNGVNPRQGEDFFAPDPKLYVLYSFVFVPGLKRFERVVKVNAEFEVLKTGLVKVSARVPRNQQRN